MRLIASCEIEFQTTVPVPAILMLRPRSGWGQWISREEYQFQPNVPVVEYTDMTGNICQRVVFSPGTTSVRAQCTAETFDKVDVALEAAYIPPQNLPEYVLHYLLPSRYCPLEEFGGLAAQIVRGVSTGYPQVEAIRQWLQKNIEYRYGTSTAATTAADTSRERSGVCRDFAHLGISLCRTLNIPARMAVGYSLELKVPDIHAWFEAYVGGRWYIFDGTQEQTSGNRICIAYGRDATDVAIVTQFGPLQLTRIAVAVTPDESGI